MTDDTTLELLSRHLDGELSASEAEQLKLRLAADTELAAELAEMKELCSAVQSVAAKMEPPAELDALLEPLRRSGRPRSRLRPAHQWLAAAAMLAIGVTVAVEVARRRPGPEIDSPAPASRPLHAEKGYFQLKPLPTAAPEEAELVGATDHLLASEPPEPMPGEPPALEVMGPLPLEDGVPSDAPSNAPVGETKSSAEKQETGVQTTVPSAAKGTSTTSGEARRQELARSTMARDSVREEEAEGDAAGRAARAAGSVVGLRAQLKVVLDGQDLVFRCVASPSTRTGRYAVLITVRDSRVVHCRASGDGDDDPGAGCDPVYQLAVSGLTDGDHEAEVVVTDGGASGD